MRAIIDKDEPAPLAGAGGADDVPCVDHQRGLAKDPAKRWQSMRDRKRARQLAASARCHGRHLRAHLYYSWLRPGHSAASRRKTHRERGDSGHLVDEARRERAEMLTVHPRCSPGHDVASVSRPPHGLRFCDRGPLQLQRSYSGWAGASRWAPWPCAARPWRRKRASPPASCRSPAQRSLRLTRSLLLRCRRPRHRAASRWSSWLPRRSPNRRVRSRARSRCRRARPRRAAKRRPARPCARALGPNPLPRRVAQNPFCASRQTSALCCALAAQSYLWASRSQRLLADDAGLQSEAELPEGSKAFDEGATVAIDLLAVGRVMRRRARVQLRREYEAMGDPLSLLWSREYRRRAPTGGRPHITYHRQWRRGFAEGPSSS